MGFRQLISDRRFCPGPTEPHVSTLEAYKQVSLYHRAQGFYDQFKDCQRKLAQVLGTKEMPLLLSSSATGAMEAAMINLTEENDEILVLNAGKFGERWQKLGAAYKTRVNTISCAAGEVPSLKSIEAAVTENNKIRAVFLQACETSTGVYLPIKEIAQVIRQRSDALIVVDAVSSLVAHEIQGDNWGIDCIVGGSQKGFGVAPGLSLIALSPKAWSRLSSRPKFYFDLKKERDGQKDGRSAFTPPTTLILALSKSLDHILSVGPKQYADYHSAVAHAMRETVLSMNLELFAPENPANSVTAVKLPSSVDGKALQVALNKQYGLLVAGGQDALAGKILRISHLGSIDPWDLLAVVGGLDLALRNAGHRFDEGRGPATFLSNIRQLF
ncbi:MAG: alanine--glyoxylate aminotransferase family protein [Oligoflexales bacterium]